MASYSDSFTYSDQYIAITSSAWEHLSAWNGCLVASNQLHGDGSYSACAVKSATAAFSNNYRIGCTIKALDGSNYVGLIARVNAATGYGVGCYWASGDAYVSKFTGTGSSEDVITSFGGASVDDFVEIEASGDDLLIYKNSTLIYTATNALVAHTSGQPGCLFFGDSGYLDNFVANDVGGPPSSNAVAAFMKHHAKHYN